MPAKNPKQQDNQNGNITEDTMAAGTSSGYLDLYDKLEVVEYIATIVPGYDWKSLSENSREAEFKNLEGGTTQYTITVSAIIGKAKMKGVTIKAYLPPFLHRACNVIHQNAWQTKLQVSKSPGQLQEETFTNTA